MSRYEVLRYAGNTFCVYDKAELAVTVYRDLPTRSSAEAIVSLAEAFGAEIPADASQLARFSTEYLQHVLVSDEPVDDDVLERVGNELERRGVATGALFEDGA